MGIKGKFFLERAPREKTMEDLRYEAIKITEQERDILSFLRSLVVAFSMHGKLFLDCRTEDVEEIREWRSEEEITSYLNEELIEYEYDDTIYDSTEVARAMRILSKMRLVKKIDGSGWRITTRGALQLTIDIKDTKKL